MARRVIVRRGPHAQGCRHCRRVSALGRDFRLWRESWEARCEQVAVGYRTETALFSEDCPAPTFKTYLVAMTGSGWPMSGAEPQRRRWAA